MLKAALKNFFINSKYLFTVMGVVYLAVILSLFLMGAGLANILSGNINASYNDISVYFSEFFSDFKAGDLFKTGYLNDLIAGFLSTLDTNVDNAAVSVIGLSVGAITIIILGCKLGRWLCRYLIKKDISNKETKKGILVTAVRLLVSGGVTVLYAFLCLQWFLSAIILTLLFIVLKSLESIFVVWYVYFSESRLKDMVHPRYVLNSVAANYLSIFFCVLIIIILSFITHFALAVFLGIPLIVYSFAINEFTLVTFFNAKRAEGYLPVVQKENRTKKAKKGSSVN